MGPRSCPPSPGGPWSAPPARGPFSSLRLLLTSSGAVELPVRDGPLGAPARLPRAQAGRWVPRQLCQGSPGDRTAGSKVCAQTQLNCPCLPFRKKSAENKCDQKRKTGSRFGRRGPLLESRVPSPPGLVPQRPSRIKPQCKIRVRVCQGPDAVPTVCVWLGGAGVRVTRVPQSPHPPRLANRQQTSAKRQGLSRDVCHFQTPRPLHVTDPRPRPSRRARRTPTQTVRPVLARQRARPWG